MGWTSHSHFVHEEKYLVSRTEVPLLLQFLVPEARHPPLLLGHEAVFQVCQNDTVISAPTVQI